VKRLGKHCERMKLGGWREIKVGNCGCGEEREKLRGVGSREEGIR
jgi:hypothetical protein